MLTALNSGTPEQLSKDIERMKTLTNKPFGCNLTILPAMVPPDYEAFARVIIESGVKIVETAGNNPKKWVKMFKEAGLICIHKCVAVRHALSAERIGVDIISLDSMECGGHPGEDDIGGIVLLAKGAKVLKKPFIASGGIANGAQLAAALALGAEGVNMGTRFCATQECNWPDSFKKRMLEADERQTVLIFRALHNTARVFKNKVASEVHRIELEKGQNIEFSDVAELVMGKRGREAEKNEDPDGGIWTASQAVGLIDEIPTVTELVDSIMQEAESIIKNRMVGVLDNSRL